VIHVLLRSLSPVAQACLAVVMLSACSASGDDASPGDDLLEQRRQQQEVFFRCLEEQGIPMERGEDGYLRVVESGSTAAERQAANEVCGELIHFPPDDPPTEEEQAKTLAMAQLKSACMRAEGIIDYPDPDPRTLQPELSREQMERYRSDPDYARAESHCTDRVRQEFGLDGTAPEET
jgi:hypothetical protein